MKEWEMDSFLLCLRVECLEQFALLQFVQSTACMSLGDPAGLQPEPHVRRGRPRRGFTVGRVGGVMEDVLQK